MFQFHEGPIKTSIAETLNVHLRGFNSMKVRLKPAPAYAEAYSNPVFQFHEGPIKT